MTGVASALPEAARGSAATSPPLPRLRARMRRPDVAPELYFPLDLAHWEEGGLRLDSEGRAATRSQVSGVRFHPADPAREDFGPERLTQRDVVRLVRTLRTLRREEGFEDLVLAARPLRTRRPEGEKGRRVRFGLASGGAAARDDARAATGAHRAIRRAIHRSGFRVLEPRGFDPKTGLAGLEAWGDALVLGRRRPYWLALLLLPLLLLFTHCDETSALFGVPIEDGSLIILLDKSSSMGEHFGAVRAEAKALLDRWLERGGTRHANIVAYDDGAVSALGGLEELTPATRDRLLAFLDGLQAGGGTRLEAGLTRAAEEVSAHGEATTLFILTDARDASIAKVNDDFETLRAGFGETGFTGHGLTPRLFQGGDPMPQDDHERGLAELAERLGGRFGPTEDAR